LGNHSPTPISRSSRELPLAGRWSAATSIDPVRLGLPPSSFANDPPVPAAVVLQRDIPESKMYHPQFACHPLDLNLLAEMLLTHPVIACLHQLSWDPCGEEVQSKSGFPRNRRSVCPTNRVQLQLHHLTPGGKATPHITSPPMRSAQPDTNRTLTFALDPLNRETCPDRPHPKHLTHNRTLLVCFRTRSS